LENSYKLQFRIKTQKDITRLLQQGVRWKSNIFAVIYLPNSLNQDRFNVLVSKKNGPAPERVRIKRVYREAYINTEVEPEQFYDILVRPYYGREHNFNKVKALYEKWRQNISKE
jgi:ribonuclease P protein component